MIFTHVSALRPADHGAIDQAREARIDSQVMGVANPVIAAVFAFPTESVDKYEKVFEVGGAAITEQPKRLSHVCYRTEHGFAVVDVWADEQSFAAFGEVIGPAMQRAGLDGRPMVYPVHGIVTQDGQRSR